MKRNRLRKSYFFYNHLVLVTLVAAILFLSFSLFSLFQKERQSLIQKQETDTQLVDVESRKATLEKDLATLETTRGQEALLRDTFDIAHPGEDIIVLLDAPSATSTKKITKDFWSFITQFFQ